MKILFTSIIRTRKPFLKRWNRLMTEIAKNFNYPVLSVYENDSTDGTKKTLKSLNYNGFKEVSIISEDIGTKYFTSVPNAERVRNMSIARNKCIDVFKDKDFDFVINIESDIDYNPEHFKYLLENNDQYDLCSGLLMYKNKFYDTWCLRLHKHMEWFKGPLPNTIRFPLWATANGLQIIRWKVFKSGIRYSHISKITNKFDCDTAIICDDMHTAGFNRIVIDKRFVCYHGDNYKPFC